MSSDINEQPALGEWTSRADLCDMLNEPVGSCYFCQVCTNCSYVALGFLTAICFHYRLELLWLESTLDFPILISPC